MPREKKMKVLIIGGTGLISTSITRQLVDAGHDVTLVNRGKSDDRNAGVARVITMDRKDYAAFKQHFGSGDTYDAVIDMVCFVPEDAQSIIETFAGRTQQVIFCSTVCACGGPALSYPIKEMDPLRPISGYGRNKARCEELLLQAGERGDFAVTVLRPSQTYGEGGVIVHSMGGSTAYIDRIRKGKPIIVHGDGSCIWAACHIDDVARGFVGAVGNPKAHGNIYNVTGEEWMTWNMYHQGVAEALGCPVPELVHIPTDLLAMVAPDRFNISIEIFQWPSFFDNSSAMRDLGFKYTIPWVEGVRRTVAWLDAHNKIVNSDDQPFEDALIAAWREKCTELAAHKFTGG
jgi:nucleoside-diphosphate-sugar epimerase